MIKTFVGPMFSGKSDALVNIYKRIYNKEHILAFKPYIDTRDGAMIKSKNYKETIPAILIDDLSEIKKYVLEKDICTVFIDEVQFIKGDARDLLDLSVIYDIDFYIAGLNMTSEQKPFGIIGDILAISDEIENITASCQDCNRTTRFTYYTLDNKTNDNCIGDNGYIALCSKCLKKRLNNRYGKILTLKRGE